MIKVIVCTYTEGIVMIINSKNNSHYSSGTIKPLPVPSVFVTTDLLSIVIFETSKDSDVSSRGFASLQDIFKTREPANAAHIV